MRISFEPRYLLEALVYFNHRVNGQRISDRVDEMAADFGDNTVKLEEMLSPLIQLEAFLDEQIDVDGDRLEFFFRYLFHGSNNPITPITQCNIAALLLGGAAFGDAEPEEAFRSLTVLSEPEVISNFLFGLNQTDSALNKVSLDFKGLAAYLKSLSMPEQIKWRIMDAGMSYTELIGELAGILCKAARQIEGRKTLYKPLLEAFGKKYGEAGDLRECLRDKLLCNLKPYRDITLFPMLMVYNGVCLTTPGTSGGEREVLVFAGVFAEEFKTANANEASVDMRFPDIIKLLADPTRFDILCTLRDRPSYGQELSERFNVNRTTVYHHLNKLQKIHFVEPSFSGAKIYFTMNKQNVRKFMMRLNKLLLGE